MKYSDERIRSNELETTQAKRDSALANESSAKANERAANLEKEAAFARLELEQIKQKQEPRIITPEKRAEFLAYIQITTERGKVAIASNAPDNETLLFMQQLSALLLEAKYDVRKVGLNMPNISMLAGRRQSIAVEVA